MKINDAWVFNPLTEGTLEDPYLCVEVSEQPNLTRPYDTFGNYSLGKYGPFVSCLRNDKNNVPALVTDYNDRFGIKFEVAISVAVFVGDSIESYNDWYLPLSWARRYMRKYTSNWNLRLSTRDAEQGLLRWTPREIRSICYADATEGRTPSCRHHATSEVVVNNVLVPFCNDCRHKFNARQSEARQRREKSA